MKQISTITRNCAAPVLTRAATATLQRQCACGEHAVGGECESCKKKKSARVEREASSHEAPDAEHARVHDTVQSPGNPLDPQLRSEMEAKFDQDFSKVRVHTDVRAAESARALHANAWALGNDVAFAQGAYEPHSAQGQHLIAHELAHVVQQRHAPAADPQTDLEVSEPGDEPEREAEAAADQVLAGDRADVTARADGVTVHRDLSGGAIAGIAGGAALLGLGAAWAAGAFDSAPEPKADDDASNIEKPPECGVRQFAKIKPAITMATSWVKTALKRIRDFKSNPKPAADDYVRARLNARFKSDIPETVNTVERVTGQIQRLLLSPSLKTECHVEKTDTLCSWATAYVARDTGTVVYCARYFQPGSTNANVIVHELAHAVTGGVNISDRGYKHERILPELSTPEALTNAESYAEFIQELAEGKPVVNPIPQDEFNCPKELTPGLKVAMAKAQRWNTNSANVFLSPTPDSQKQAAALRNQFLPPTFPISALMAIDTTAIDLPYISTVLKKTSTGLNAPVKLACEPEGPSCAVVPTGIYVAPGDPQIHLCPKWREEGDADKQVTSLLAALYGVFGGETRADWQMGLARMAQAVTSTSFALPNIQDIYGSSTWNKDAISVSYVVYTRIPGAQFMYTERSNLHSRLSKDVPVYQGPVCQSSHLPFEFSAFFSVDSTNNRRPGPFTPPVLTLEYKFDSEIGPDPANSEKRTDANPEYQGPGVNLKTPIGAKTSLVFQRNGKFGTKLRLEDPDTSTIREYADEIQVIADVPCGLRKGEKLA